MSSCLVGDGKSGATLLLENYDDDYDDDDDSSSSNSSSISEISCEIRSSAGNENVSKKARRARVVRAISLLAFIIFSSFVSTVRTTKSYLSIYQQQQGFLLSKETMTTSVVTSMARITEVTPTHPTLSHMSHSASSYFNCSHVNDITIVREIGRGDNKITYEVLLPITSATSASTNVISVKAAAKRCKSVKCEELGHIKDEEYYFRTLYEQYGAQGDDSGDAGTIIYYGYCNFDKTSTNITRRIKYKGRGRNQKSLYHTEDIVNFAVGPTLFIEMGHPFMNNWHEWKTVNVTRITKRRERKQTITKEERKQIRLADTQYRPQLPEELESLRTIARQYANYKHGPLLLVGDNIHGHQYATFERSGSSSDSNSNATTTRIIRHVDFDNVINVWEHDATEFLYSRAELRKLASPPIPPTNATNTTITRADILNKNCQILLGDFAQLKRKDPRFYCHDNNNTTSQ